MSATTPGSWVRFPAAERGNVLAELKMTCAESSITATRVVGEGMLWSSVPQRYSGLASPTNVPRTSFRRTSRRSR